MKTGSRSYQPVHMHFKTQPCCDLCDLSSEEKWFHSADNQSEPCLSNCTFLLLCVLFLTDPVFVGSAYIEESQPIGNPVGDDDKIYFFFSEAGKEFDFFDNTIVSRIARVCKVRCGTGSQTKTMKEV